jgi:gliding motility-associated-like protein
MRILFLILALLTFRGLAAQYTYVSQIDGNIYRLDLSNNCSHTLFASYPGSFITDIAVHPSGLVYFSTQDSLFTIDPLNLPAGRVFLVKLNNQVNALEFGPDGMLYAAGKAVIRYDPASGILTTLGLLPGSLHSAGDLIFYNNQLYMSGSDGSIYAINMNDPAQSTAYYELSVTNIQGMVVLPVSCFNDPVQKYRVFAFENINNGSNTYMIDMESKTAFPDYCRPAIGISGAATINPPAVVGNQIIINNINITGTYCRNSIEGRIAINISSTPAERYSFSIDNNPDTHDPVFTGLVPGSHSIRIKNQNGCYKDTLVLIPYVAEQCIDSVYIPNAFTPNGDGRNDIFKATSFLGVTDFRLNIYNRYGLLVFSSTSIQQGWTGLYQGTAQPTSTYVWWASYTNRSGKAIFRKGSLVLVR